jgi:hypothetical protein
MRSQAQSKGIAKIDPNFKNLPVITTKMKALKSIEHLFKLVM